MSQTGGHRFPSSDVEPEPDIVKETLQVAMDLCAELPQEVADRVYAYMQTKRGGMRHFLPKTAKRLTPEQREALFRDGLTNMTTEEITQKHKISRRTLYRAMKQGGRFGG